MVGNVNTVSQNLPLYYTDIAYNNSIALRLGKDVSFHSSVDQDSTTGNANIASQNLSLYYIDIACNDSIAFSLQLGKVVSFHSSVDQDSTWQEM